MRKSEMKMDISQQQKMFNEAEDNARARQKKLIAEHADWAANDISGVWGALVAAEFELIVIKNKQEELT